ncbi:MAG: sigma 54-interacting transcriptional regulator [Phycisphaerales bacterium]|nr:sigma 54-interacting transcriptional regulator [Phycisphaerales bacterium]
MSLNILREISQIMGSSLDLKKVFDRVMRVLAAELGFETGRLVILDAVSGQLRIEIAHGLTPEEQARGIYALGEGVTGQVFTTGLPRVISDVRQEPDYLDRTRPRKSHEQPYSFIGLPITSESQTIGVLCADKPFVDQPTLDHEVEILTIVSAMIAQSVCISGMVHREKEELLDELSELRKIMHDRYQFANIIGSSPPMLSVFRTIEQVARARATILIMGETGTGKELIAKALHYNSDRADKPFIRVNCGALSGHLLESELFGHIKGAFTGAIRDKTGRFEAANGGTIFLDEIATMEMTLQVKLLRVLQEREFERVGDYRTRSVDVRVIAASNLDLEEEVRAKRFREDLYYRLNVVVIQLPPLRDRKEDIPQLIDCFLDKYNAENDRNLRRMSRDVLNLLLRYYWPGNVRELENTIERAVVLSDGQDFTMDLLPTAIRAFADKDRPRGRMESPDELIEQLVRWAMSDVRIGVEGQIWPRFMSLMERALIGEALKRCGGTKIKAADYLGINRNTLNKKHRELGLDGGEFRLPPTDCT